MQIIDNFLDDKNFLLLKTHLESMDFPWFYIPTVSLPPGAVISDPLARETFGYNHIAYDSETENKSFFFPSLTNILIAFEDTFQQKIKKLLRARLSVKHPKVGFTRNNYNLPHVDYFFPHSTLIYYINDSDGDTIIFDEVFDENAKGEPTEFSIKTRVTPKANRMLYLKNGYQYHTASNPISTDRRIILNINLIV
jgi:hypothetical protein